MQSIDNSNEYNKLVSTLEVVFEVDSIEIDDSYLPLGFTNRDKEFLNVRSSRQYETPRSYWTDQEISNNPMQVFVIGTSLMGKSYERNVYNLNDMLGNVGGMLGILQSLAGVVAYIFSRNIIDTKFICIF